RPWNPQPGSTAFLLATLIAGEIPPVSREESEVTGLMRLALAPFEGAVEVGQELPCRRYDPDLWFAETPAELEVAKAFCAECPVRLECLAAALERREPWGVWGGEIFERGAIVARKRPRGRPRKDAAAAEAQVQAE